jgi:hypothetical protein
VWAAWQRAARQRKGAPIEQKEQRETEELYRNRLQRFGDMLLTSMGPAATARESKTPAEAVRDNPREEERMRGRM